ncbi:unnamed protein product [Commensalibacter communis]|nr:unnamed protein product [Commensalibacter communis]CAI3956439.1 unnamed protein product [Commensalibacter communis]
MRFFYKMRDYLHTTKYLKIPNEIQLVMFFYLL